MRKTATVMSKSVGTNAARRTLGDGDLGTKGQKLGEE